MIGVYDLLHNDIMAYCVLMISATAIIILLPLFCVSMVYFINPDFEDDRYYEILHRTFQIVLPLLTLFLTVSVTQYIISNTDDNIINQTLYLIDSIMYKFF
jgi:hypothetical protein